MPGFKISEALLRQRCLVVDGAGQEALGRAKGNEADPQPFERGKDLIFQLAPTQRVLALQSRDRLNSVSAADGLHVGRQSPN